MLGKQGKHSRTRQQSRIYQYIHQPSAFFFSFFFPKYIQCLGNKATLKSGIVPSVVELASCLIICFFSQRPLPFYQQNVFALISPINMPNKECDMVKFMVKQG